MLPAVGSQENMSYLEAESLIAESYALSYPNTPITPETIRSWCMEDSAKVRQDTIQKEANFLVAGGLNDITSPSFQSMQQEMTRKVRTSQDRAGPSCMCRQAAHIGIL